MRVLIALALISGCLSQSYQEARADQVGTISKCIAKQCDELVPPAVGSSKIPQSTIPRHTKPDVPARKKLAPPKQFPDFWLRSISSDVKVLAAVPDDSDDLVRIFARILDEDEASKTFEEAKILLSRPNTRAVKSHNEIFDEIKSGNPYDPIALVGHNEGGFLRLPSGRRISIDRIIESCEENHRVCLFFMCKSQSYIDNGTHAIGVGAELTFLDADRLLRSFARKRLRTTPEELSDMVNHQIIKDDKWKQGELYPQISERALLITGALSGGGALILIVQPKDDRLGHDVY